APFNAVGFVGKDTVTKKEKLTIHSYTDNFSKESSNRRTNFSNLVSYFQKRPIEEFVNQGTRVYYNLFLNALIELLKSVGISETKTSLFNDISIEDKQVMDEFKQLSFQWIRDIELKNKSAVDIKNEFLIFFKSKGLDFSQSPFALDNTVLPQNEFKVKSNIFSKNNIDIKIGTIHSVKGETHMATLLFENQNYGSSEGDYFFSEQSGNLFCGEEYRRPQSYKRLEERLKTTYVAMSRPSHLLCIAMSKDRVGCITCPDEKKERCNWEVIL
ncbi:hypothetical protein CGI34_25620, partial [Vibrio parahaemolyticus]